MAASLPSGVGTPALRISNFECDSLERRRCKTLPQKIRLGVFDKPSESGGDVGPKVRV